MKSTKNVGRLLAALMIAALIVPTIATAPVHAFDPLADAALQVWYKMDETSGTTMTDSSGNGNNGTVSNAGVFGTGGYLNLSSNRYATLPQNVLRNVPGDFTITCRVYYTSGGTWARLFDFGPATTSNIIFCTANTLQVNMNNGSALTAPTAVNNANNTNKWRAITITRTGNTTRIYVNGSQVASGTQTGTANRQPTTGGFYIGRSNWTSDPYPTMRVDDFMIFSRALSAAELQDLYSDLVLEDVTINSTYFDGDALPTELLGYPATWTAADGVSVVDGKAVGGPATKQVDVTATFGPYTKTFNITILSLSNIVVLDKSNGSPIYPNFTGDPSVTVVGDTVYVIGGQDEGASSYIIPRYVCYSSKDLINWTFHGTVMSITDVSWRNDTISCWASQMVEYRGKYYLYYCTWNRLDSGRQAIGVAVANSPTGPYVDKGSPLVSGNLTTPQTENWDDIDPTVLVETVNGVERRILAWGNTRYYHCELNEDMISVKDQNGDGNITGADITYTSLGSSYTEAPWLYERQGIYYNFYARGWRENLAYFRSTSPFGPWTFAASIMDPAATSNTSHPAVIDFKGKTYLFYHNGMLPGGSGYSRSVLVNELRFDANGRVYPMYESSIGIAGFANTIKTQGGAAVGIAPFTHGTADSSYPYSRPIRVGTAGDETAWEIIQGRGREGDAFVSIQAVFHPGLLITPTSNTAVTLTQDTGANRQVAQTFITVQGLAGSGVSFMSLQYPGRYLTNNSGTLALSDGSVAANCTFNVELTDVNPYKAITGAGTFTPVPDPDYRIISQFVSGTAAGAKLEVNVDDPNVEEVNMIVAVYAANGALKSVKIKAIDVTYIGIYPAYVVLDAPLAPGDTCRVYAWDGITFVPLCPAAEVVT